MTEFESQILYFFDKSPTSAQIKSLASMYGVSENKIIDILRQHGREIPEKKKGPKPKAKGRKADAVIIDDNENKSTKNENKSAKYENGNPKNVIKDSFSKNTIIMRIPDCVIITIEKRMHELENDIKNYQEAIKNYQDMVNRLEGEYKAHADYLLNCPFEQQRNLSQDCSENKIESPQADA